MYDSSHKYIYIYITILIILNIYEDPKRIRCLCMSSYITSTNGDQTLMYSSNEYYTFEYEDHKKLVFWLTSLCDLKKRKTIDICRISSIENLFLQINKKKLSIDVQHLILYHYARCNVWACIRISFCGIERRKKGKNEHTIKLITYRWLRESFLI